MRRTLIVASCGTLLILAVSLAMLKLPLASTIAALASAAVLFHILVVLVTNGLHVGYLEQRYENVHGAVDAWKRLFAGARESIKVVVGALGPNTLFSKEIFDEFRNALNRGVSVQILLGEPRWTFDRVRDRIDPQMWKEFGEWVRQKKVEVRRTFRRTRPHFIVVDGMHVWLEELHHTEGPVSDTEKRRSALIYFDERAPRYAQRFVRHALRSTSINP